MVDVSSQKCKWDRKFLYPLKHMNRKTGTTTTTFDLNYAGYLDAIYDKISSVESKIEHFGSDDGGVTRYCISKVTVVTCEGGDSKKCRTFSAYGEANTANGDPVGKLASYAETRAKKRCFATALNLTQYDFNDPSHVNEEEPGTRVVDEVDATPTDSRSARLNAMADKVRALQSRPKPIIVDGEGNESSVGEW